jgi:hypothetical protein
MSHLVQLYLPLADNDGNRFDRSTFQAIEDLLSEEFQGFTSFARAPADGVWGSMDERVQREDIVVYEVIVAELNRDWWSQYRLELERELEQEKILIRAHRIEIL